MHTVRLIDDSSKLPFIYNKQNHLLQKNEGCDAFSPTYTLPPTVPGTYNLVALIFKPNKQHPQNEQTLRTFPDLNLHVRQQYCIQYTAALQQS